MTRTIFDVYVLQTVPPSNINRDENGSPKTAIYGGIQRPRVSSQAWKRATREDFGAKLDPADLGVRTKRVAELLAEEITSLAPQLAESSEELAEDVFKTAGIKLAEKRKDAAADAQYLIFLSRHQIRALAQAAVESTTDDSGTKLDKNTIKEIANRDHSIDVALFGRMVTDQKDLSVDAAVQVAHAIGVHAAETEFDYFTAVDECLGESESGAGMLASTEFTSATLYRYATLDVDRLAETLGDTSATRRAAEAFLESFVRSMPTGKQTSFAHRTLPEAVVVVARDSQPINLVGAFEMAIRESDHAGRVQRASEALRDEAQEIQRAYGETPIASWVTRVGSDTAALDDLGSNVPLDAMVNEAGKLVAERLEARP